MAVESTPLSVSQLTAQIKYSLSELFSGLLVRGEVSDLTRARSGHLYFNLKDDSAKISAVMWKSSADRLRFKLEEGLEVICHGEIDVYAPRGSYQLNVRRMDPEGVGGLQLAFEQLKKKLHAEGLFDPARKRTLPYLPRRIGVVTSPQGAAIRDFLQVLERRFQRVEVTIFPCKVQGPGAAQEITRAIGLANRVKPALDVLVVCRGGGSL